MLELAGKSAALTRWLAENEAKKVDGAPPRPCYGAAYEVAVLSIRPWVGLMLTCNASAQSHHAVPRGPVW